MEDLVEAYENAVVNGTRPPSDVEEEILDALKAYQQVSTGSSSGEAGSCAQAKPREVAECLLERICHEIVSNENGGAEFAEYITDELSIDYPHVEINVDYRNGHVHGVNVPETEA